VEIGNFHCARWTQGTAKSAASVGHMVPFRFKRSQEGWTTMWRQGGLLLCFADESPRMVDGPDRVSGGVWSVTGRHRGVPGLRVFWGQSPPCDDRTGELSSVRWPGWLGLNSTRFSSHRSFTYGEADVPCAGIQVATDRVRVTEGRRVCLTFKGDVHLRRWWWLRKLSPDMRDRFSN